MNYLFSKTLRKNYEYKLGQIVYSFEECFMNGCVQYSEHMVSKQQQQREKEEEVCWTP